jgi:hypothetical protein
MPYSNFYFKNWFTQLLFRMTHMRLYMYLDLVLLVINLVLLCLPQVMEGTIPGLGKLALLSANVKDNHLYIHCLEYGQADSHRLEGSARQKDLSIPMHSCCAVCGTVFVNIDRDFLSASTL